MRGPGGVWGSSRSGDDNVAKIVPVNLLVGPVETSLPFFWFSKLVQFVGEFFSKCLFCFPGVASQTTARILEQ